MGQRGTRGTCPCCEATASGTRFLPQLNDTLRMGIERRPEMIPEIAEVEQIMRNTKQGAGVLGSRARISTDILKPCLRHGEDRKIVSRRVVYTKGPCSKPLLCMGLLPYSLLRTLPLLCSDFYSIPWLHPSLYRLYLASAPATVQMS